MQKLRDEKSLERRNLEYLVAHRQIAGVVGRNESHSASTVVFYQSFDQNASGIIKIGGWFIKE